MVRTDTPRCPNCGRADCKRLSARQTKVVGQKDRFNKKFSQPATGVGWICKRCKVLFSDEQLEKHKRKLYSELYSEKVRDAFDRAYWFLNRLS